VSKIGLDLTERIAAEQAKPRVAASAPALRMRVYVVVRGDLEPIRRAGFDLVAPFGPVASGDLTIDEIERLARRDDVVSINLPPRIELQLDRSVPDIRAPAAWGVPPVNSANTSKGGGAICGIIDTGFDVFHGSLRKASGETRIRFYWDQTFRYDANGNPVDINNNPLTGDNEPLDETDNVATPLRAPTVPGCNFGIEFEDHQIDDALARHPDGKDLPISLRDDDGSGHGTHVAGTAAGDGSDRDRCTPPFTYQGVAPEADLIVVKLGASAGRIADPLNAINYIFAKAQLLGRPCVINMSFDTHARQHNGFSDLSIAIDSALAGTTGRAVVIAASNDREGNRHVAERVDGDTTTTINLVVEDGLSSVAVFGSYDSISALTYRIRMPRLPPPAPVRQSQVFDPLAAALQVTQGHTFTAAVVPSAAGDPDRHFSFSITRPAPGATVEAGPWQIDLIATGAFPSNVHLWQYLPPTGNKIRFRPFGFQPVLPVADPSPQDAARPPEWRRPARWISSTLTSWTSTRSAITVAAYNAESANTPIAAFSSQGPVPLDLTQGLFPSALPDKPDIAAPGVTIHAPYANQRKCFLCCECWVTHHRAMDGTSQAAPHVTGVAALMFAQDPTLSAADVKQIMKENVRAAPLLPAGWPNSDVLFGAGMIDAVACAIIARDHAEGLLGGGGAPPIRDAFVIAPPPLRHPWRDFEDRLRAWERLFGKRPAWQLCAFLISTHFDEVKRLIDTNRRVAVVWQRYGGPLLVRRILLGEQDPDPPLPERIGERPVLVLIDKLIAILERYGSPTLRADAARYRDFVRRLPGTRIADIDTLLSEGAPS
jgi:subtilisin family serine protease